MWKLFVFLVIVLIVVAVAAEHNTWPSLSLHTQNTQHTPYESNFLSDADFAAICADFQHRQKDLVSEDLGTVKRENLEVSSDSVVYRILSKPQYRDKLRNLTGNSKIYLARNFPVEYRRYSKGSYMSKHRDTQLYVKPQYECILTLSNSSDSRTIFYLPGQTSAIHSKPNSIMFVRANGVKHEVLPVTVGERCFIKFIMTETDEFY